ncbi:TPA: hypothetical protein DEB00_03440 [Candidatus Uhrbacteria bacterium]|nr:hypothetical protein [Candidatus Uhrbacteria bacterium]
MAFFIRQLDNASTGAALRSLRKKQGISLDTIAKQTQIQRKYLEAFEENAYHLLPDPLYAKHFLKLFVLAINGDVAYFTARYGEECGSCSAVTDQLRIPRQRTGKRLLMRWRTWAKAAGFACVLGLLFLYIGFQLHNLLAPPNLLVDSPSDNVQTTVATLTVGGQTDKEVQITVNNDPILTDPTGRFETRLTLTRGLNIIEVVARKKYGQPQVVRRSVFLEEIGSARSPR